MNLCSCLHSDQLLAKKSNPVPVQAGCPKDCALCGKGSGGETKLMRCSKCSVTYYCSREHQIAHWKVHKSECGAQSARAITSQTNYAEAKQPPVTSASDGRGSIPVIRALTTGEISQVLDNSAEGNIFCQN